MKKFLILLTIASILTAASCRKDCPPGQKIGDRPLTEKSLRFFAYADNPNLIFKDKNGNEITFTSEKGVETEINKIAVYKQCTEAKYDGKSTYDYFEGETKRIVYRANQSDLLIDMLITTNTLRPEEELFYDLLTIDVSGVNSIGRGEIATDIRFSNAYDESEFNIQFPLTFIDKVTLNGVSFENVYETDSFEGRKVYYNQDKGVVGIQTQTELYRFDRTE